MKRNTQQKRHKMTNNNQKRHPIAPLQQLIYSARHSTEKNLKKTPVPFTPSLAQTTAHYEIVINLIQILLTTDDITTKAALCTTIPLDVYKYI
jgi:hypothetical protein